MDNSSQKSLKNRVKIGCRDTGFEEPFSTYCNTTLPHPEADTSPNATLEGRKFDWHTTNNRQRKLLKGFCHRSGNHSLDKIIGYEHNQIYAKVSNNSQSYEANSIPRISLESKQGSLNLDVCEEIIFEGR